MVEIRQTIRRADGTLIEIAASRQAVEIGVTRASSGYVSAGAGQPAFWMSAEDWKQLLARAWEHAGEHWHRNILAKHFTHRGATEYGYQERSVKHNRRKLRKFGHTYPNVFTGEMKHAVMRARELSATSKGGKVVLYGPTHLYAFRKDYKQPDKAAEISAISEADARELAAVIDRYIEQELNKDGGRSAAAGHRGPGLADAAT